MGVSAHCGHLARGRPSPSWLPLPRPRQASLPCTSRATPVEQLARRLSRPPLAAWPGALPRWRVPCGWRLTTPKRPRTWWAFSPTSKKRSTISRRQSSRAHTPSSTTIAPRERGPADRRPPRRAHSPGACMGSPMHYTRRARSVRPSSALRASLRARSIASSWARLREGRAAVDPTRERRPAAGRGLTWPRLRPRRVGDRRDPDSGPRVRRPGARRRGSASARPSLPCFSRAPR
jgi:hypothetical protein